jgi:hypothetical protein
VKKMKVGERLFCCVGFIGLLSAVGCGGTYDSSAHGLVTLDGQAIQRGLATFHPTSAGPAAYAIINESGTYEVFTGREKGLPSGEYLVSVVANEAPAISQTASGGAPPPGKPITPEWYRTKQTSGLKYTIKPGGNEINLELSTKPPAGWKPGGQKQT